MAGSHETPFKMKGSGFYGLGNQSPVKAKSSPAKGPDVIIDGVNEGTGDEAYAKGRKAEVERTRITRRTGN